MEKNIFFINGIPTILWGKPSQQLFLYIHGKGGNKEEAQSFSGIVCQRGYQVLSIDLPGHGQRKAEIDLFDPWHIIPELKGVMNYAKEQWRNISLYTNSIGAWFSMLSFTEEALEECFFVSPVVDMKRLVSKMMEWAKVSEAQLQQELIIPTDFGQTLSWEYWKYILEHPVTAWTFPTMVLYGEKDNLTDRDSIEDFARKFKCDLTIMKNGEHWFHTPEQLDVLEGWVKENVPDKKC